MKILKKNEKKIPPDLVKPCGARRRKGFPTNRYDEAREY